MDKKRVIIIGIIGLILIIASIVFIVICNEKDSNDPADNNIDTTDTDEPDDKLGFTIEYENLEIKNFELNCPDEGGTVLLMTVYNDTDSDKVLGSISIDLLDNNDKVLLTIPGILPEVKSKEEINTSASLSGTCVSEANSLKIRKGE